MSATWNTIKDYNDHPLKNRKICEDRIREKPAPRFGNDKWHALSD